MERMMPGQKHVELAIAAYTEQDRKVDPAGCELGIYRSNAFEIPPLPPPHRGYRKKHHCKLPGWWGCMWNGVQPGDEWVCDCGQVYEFDEWRNNGNPVCKPIWDKKK